MVFIPGGGFGTGDGTPASFGAERFLDYEIVTFFKIKKIYINLKYFTYVICLLTFPFKLQKLWENSLLIDEIYREQNTFYKFFEVVILHLGSLKWKYVYLMENVCFTQNSKQQWVVKVASY